VSTSNRTHFAKKRRRVSLTPRDHLPTSKS
jgi:hypothetical protein